MQFLTWDYRASASPKIVSSNHLQGCQCYTQPAQDNRLPETNQIILLSAINLTDRLTLHSSPMQTKGISLQVKRESDGTFVTARRTNR
jgi:hypothetical protein